MDDLSYEFELSINSFVDLYAHIRAGEIDDAIDVLTDLEDDVMPGGFLRELIEKEAASVPTKTGLELVTRTTVSKASFDIRVKNYFEELDKRVKDLKFHILAKETSVSVLLAMKLKDVLWQLEVYVLRELGENND